MQCLGERTGLEGQVQNLVDRGNLLVRGRVQDDDDGANQADGTANLAQEAELFVEEVCAEDSADEDGEGAQGSDEDGGRKGVGGEVEDLAEDHCDDASPPRRVPQIRVAVAVEAVLLHGSIEALFGDDEAGADCERRRHSQHQADIPVQSVSMRAGGAGGAGGAQQQQQQQRTCLRPWCRGSAGVRGEEERRVRCVRRGRGCGGVGRWDVRRLKRKREWLAGRGRESMLSIGGRAGAADAQGQDQDQLSKGCRGQSWWQQQRRRGV